MGPETCMQVEKMSNQSLQHGPEVGLGVDGPGPSLPGGLVRDMTSLNGRQTQEAMILEIGPEEPEDVGA